MEDSVLSKELIEAFRPIMEMNNARFRQVKTMLAGFIATQERDLHYMDALFDFMDPESDTEMLMRQYYDYIATFDADEARNRIDSLENDMGYMTKIVYAAGLVAQKLHRGQVDKSGHDYFESHLLKVADAGFDWKEKVVGFLHDASEDCDVTVDNVMHLLDEEISESGHHEEELRQIGFSIVHRPDCKMQCAIIDQHIGWYGSLNLIGKSIMDATAIRIQYPQFADTLFEALDL